MTASKTARRSPTNDADNPRRTLLRDIIASLRYQADLGLLGISPSPTQSAPAGAGTKTADKLVQTFRDFLVPPPPLPDNADNRPSTGRGERSPHDCSSLAELQELLNGCQHCALGAKRQNLVFGGGDPNARLLFIGDSPGHDEDLRGEPFVGKAGGLLDRMIKAMTLSREEVYIANIVKCRPPGDRDPQESEGESCAPFLARQIALIGPEVIVTLGGYASCTLLNDSTPITRQRGNWRAYNGIPVMPTFHPAYLLRKPSAKGDAWRDLQAVMRRLGLV